GPCGVAPLEGSQHTLATAPAAEAGPAEILKHEHTGLLFAPRDPRAIADTLRRLVTNPQLRSRIAAAGRADLARRWTWPRIIRRIQNVYHECARSAGESARAGLGQPVRNWPRATASAQLRFPELSCPLAAAAFPPTPHRPRSPALIYWLESQQASP